MDYPINAVEKADKPFIKEYIVTAVCMKYLNANEL